MILTLERLAKLQTIYCAVHDKVVLPEEIKTNRQQANQLQRDNATGMNNAKIAELDDVYDGQRARNSKMMNKYYLAVNVTIDDLPEFAAAPYSMLLPPRNVKSARSI